MPSDNWTPECPWREAGGSFLTHHPTVSQKASNSTSMNIDRRSIMGRTLPARGSRYWYLPSRSWSRGVDGAYQIQEAFVGLTWATETKRAVWRCGAIRAIAVAS
jgi:hypothetical protein